MKTVKILMIGASLCISALALSSCGDDNEEQPINVHEAIDLGLPSGTLWADMNVGAAKPNEYGLFFAWGDTNGVTSDTTDGLTFSYATYKWTGEKRTQMDMTKYTTDDGKKMGGWYDADGNFIGDGKTVLEAEDDAAHAVWGGDWRMPTKEEVQELLDNTTSEWTTVDGINGRKFMSKVNDNYIFIPAAGSRDSTELAHQGSYGYYWSSSLNVTMSHIAISLGFNEEKAYLGQHGFRYNRRSVRPVCKK